MKGSLTIQDVARRDGEQTGIFQNFPLQGAIAVEHAIGKLQANSLGPLTEAQLHLIAGVWVPGTTAPGPRRRRPGGGAAGKVSLTLRPASK